MSKRFFCLVAAALVALISSSPLPADESSAGSLIKLKTTDFRVIVGELKAEDSISVTLIDLATGRESVIDKTRIKSMENNISDDAAVMATNLPTVVAWKIGKLHHDTSKPALGKIARISENIIYTNLGEKSGIGVGDHLAIFRKEGEVKDPDTGKVLGSERSKIAELELVEIQPAYSKARLTGNMEIKLQVGDEAETIVHPLQIAVVQPVDAAGEVPPAAATLSEELITHLVANKIPVVERERLLSALKELAIQNTELFDPATAQKFGRFVGATAILTGKIVPGVGTTSEAHIRLIEVSTGKILLAASAPIRGAAGAAGAGGAVIDGSPTTEGNAPKEDHVLAEAELGTTTGGGMNPHIYKLTLPARQEKVKLLASTVSIKMEPGKEIGNYKIDVLMSVDYGKNWITIEHYDTAGVLRGRRHNNWYHIPLAGAGATRTAKRELHEASADVDELQIRVDGGHDAGMSISTVVWSTSHVTRPAPAAPAKPNAKPTAAIIPAEPIAAATPDPADAPAPANPEPAPAAAGAHNPGSTNVVNLLRLADVKNDVVHGKWLVQNGALVAEDHDVCIFQFSYKPPEEYDYKVSFTRLDGHGQVHILCAGGGRQFNFAIGDPNDKNPWSGFFLYKGELPANRGPDPIALKNGQKCDCVVKVRKDGVKAYMNNVLISELKTDFSDFRLGGGWDLKRGDVIGLGEWGPRTAFQSVEVVEVSGKGQILH